MRIWHGILAIAMLGGCAFAAELVTLSPGNYSEYAPKGKEADAVFGDYVLRNDTIVAVVADPSLMVGRSGSRKYGVDLKANVIDLTLRAQQNDLLSTYDSSLVWPDTRRMQPANVQGEPHNQIDFKNEAETHKLPGREPREGKRVQLVLPFKAGNAEVRYTLEEGWPYLLVEMVFTNASEKVMAVKPAANLYMGPRKIPEEFLWGHDAAQNLLWVHDRWFGQAYGVLSDVPRTQLAHFPRRKNWTVQRFMPQEGEVFLLEPGTALVVHQKLFPGASLFDVRATANKLQGLAQSAVTVTVLAPDGPVVDAEVIAQVGGDVYGAGRTGEDGTITCLLPAGSYVLTVRPPGRAPQKLTVDPSEATAYEVTCESAALVVADVTDGAGHSIPCKVEFRGRGGTPDPYFFPRTGEHRVHNLFYSHTGKFRQIVPPGTYTAVLTHGPEYDAAFVELEAVAGKETALQAKLPRVVDTTGWVSADFGNRSTVSREESRASQRGRVLNLVAEHIEFAPPTERDFVSSYADHVEALGITDKFATCPGIGLSLRVRKTYTAQNAFPVRYMPGRQDGGALQRPQHVLQVFWLGGWYGELTQHGTPSWTPATDKLIQITPPAIWRNDGRSDGMYRLFYPVRYTREDPHRGGRLSILKYVDAMDVSPLHTFLELPAYDASDPKGEKDLAAWWADLDERRAKKWPDVKERNRQWPRILNLGYRMSGVVNSNTRQNFHGSGAVRNFVKSPTDQPGEIKPLDIVHAVRFGHVTMSTGPFLEVGLEANQNGVPSRAIPGDDLHAPAARARLDVKVQCPNWIDIDRVQVLFNGLAVRDLNFKRATHANFFGDGVMKFERAIDLAFDADTHVMVVIGGSGPNLRVRDPELKLTEEEVVHVAMSNPIWVDIDGDGFKPHSPIDDQVYAYFDTLSPLLTKPERKAASMRLYLKNLGTTDARDAFDVQILPAGAARIKGGSHYRYELAPGEQVEWDFELELSEGSDAKRINLYVPRSTHGIGRRTVGKAVVVNKATRPWTTMTTAQRRSMWWLPEHVINRPPNWGASARAERAMREP